nr:MAG TPA: tail assembly chaperone protein [Caudoviricetes sp.]
MNINLHFTAKNIEEIEKTTGSTVFELMNNSGISTILLFLRKGCENRRGDYGLTQEEAYSKLEELMQEKDVDTTTIMSAIIEKLVELGFLPKKLNTKAIKEVAEQQVKLLNQAAEATIKEMKNAKM